MEMRRVNAAVFVATNRNNRPSFAYLPLRREPLTRKDQTMNPLKEMIQTFIADLQAANDLAQSLPDDLEVLEPLDDGDTVG